VAAKLRTTCARPTGPIRDPPANAAVDVGTPSIARAPLAISST
jgi:hypothetical protein